MKQAIAYYIPTGKCKLKQWGAIIHQLEWPKSSTLKKPNANEDVEQQDPNSLLVEM